MAKPTVFVSGATGFIAQHVVKGLLETKKYKVVGSVRNSEKATLMKAGFENNPDLSFVIVRDLAQIDAFDESFKQLGSEIKYVFHTASPVIFDITDFEKDLIVPATNGTKGIFQAAVKYAPNVKKFILTSSFSAVCSIAEENDSSLTLIEKSWNSQPLEEAMGNSVDAYGYSKTAAEKAAWDLHKKLDPKFSLTVINPAYVFGPQCFDSSVKEKLNASCQNINEIVHSNLGDPVKAQVKGSFIHISDLAKAQVSCIENHKLNGQRLILAKDRFSLQNVVDIINAKYPSLEGKITKGEPESAKQAIEGLAKVDNHVTKELLGFPLKTLTEAVQDTVDQILRVEAAQM
ncbi:hypothetical protein ACO0RG_000731 [Hanseniaspora osmophila]|uniref:NADPH-dependent methylglyoxal reductase GRE2 n=1 Tax=Hanseniaspora osmophila TaxID=56408 RepID=A0A1E5R210_9ASCO|nr:NADPH-dependent methylglyoxal reductase GRE2 [Hanseniaspora osmophila]